jgi:hypothetical protein
VEIVGYQGSNETTEADMDEEGGRHDPVKFYGIWSWVGGFAIGGGLIWIMFAFADGFS